MKRAFVRRFVFVGLVAARLVLAPAVEGQAKIEFDDGRWLSVGGGIRATFRATEETASDSYAKDFDLDNARLYLNSQLLESFLLEFNTEYVSSSSDFRVLDAIVKFSPSEYFQVWMGRHLPPSDRANLDGPFFLSAYDYPGLVSRYPAIFAGRDDGVSVSGQVRGGVFKYAVGLYEGIASADGLPDSSLYAARLTYNFLDPEPGYYTASSYYGEKDVLAIAFATQFQKEAVGGELAREDFLGYNFDILFEKKLPNGGVVSLEGAYYDYDFGSAACGGNAYLAQAGYLVSREIGVGRLQPIVRYQEFEGDSIVDAGVNYVIRGHAARISLMYSLRDFESNPTRTSQFVVGTQFQF